MCFDFIGRNRIHAASLQVVITGVEEVARIRKFVKISFDDTLNKPIGCSSPIQFG